ncbi:MAG: hypothetical protein ACREIU_11200 [Planctomycetota bacterium]
MPSLHRLLPLLSFLLLAPAAWGRVVERLDLPKMVGKTDAAVLGTIVEVTGAEVTMNGVSEVVTRVRVRGENLYTGREDEIVVTFLGGRTEDRETWCAESPTARETRVGARTLVFSKSRWTTEGLEYNGLYAGFGGLFRVEGGPRGEVVLGRGEGYAVENNVRVSDLRDRISAIRAAGAEQRP